MKKLYLLLPVIFLLLNAQAQTGTWDWGQNGVYTLNNGPVVQTDIWCTGADVSGSGYVTGPFWGNLTVDGQPLNNSSTDDQVLTIKWDSSGTLQWVAQSVSLNSSFFSYAATYDITADNFDGLYITGNFGDTMIFGTDTLFSPERSSNMFLLKYDKNGNVRWSKQAIGNSHKDHSFGTALTTDKSNHIYIAGTFNDTVSLGATKLINKTYGFFIAKYDTGGNLIWAKQSTKFNTASIAFYGNPSGPYSIKTDKDNNLLVTGLFTDTLTYGSTSLYAPAGESSVFILKFDSNANLIWAEQGLSDSSFETSPVYVATDNSGNVYCGGTYEGTASFGSKTLPTNTSNTNFFIVKYDANGNPLWVKATGNSSSTRWTSDKLVNDNNNHLFICGNSGIGGYNTIIYNTDTITTSQAANGDGFSVLIKLDTAGKLLCSSMVAGGADDFNGMAVDTSGKYVYLGGDLLEQMILNSNDTLYKGGSTFGPQEVPFIARWQPCKGCDLIVNAPPSPTLCSGSSDTLTLTGAATYAWSPATGLSATTGSSVLASPTVTTTYNVVATLDSCTDYIQVVVTVFTPPNKPIITQKGDTLFSSAATNNQWYKNDTLIPGATNLFLVIGKTTATYTVQITDPANGCNNTSAPLITSGINRLSANSEQLSIYPNPATNQLTVFSNQPIKQITITDLLGQVIYKSPIEDLGLTKQTLNVSSWATGMYFITVTAGDAVYTDKVVVNR